MAKTLRIEDKYEAAFRNLMKANNISIPSDTIKVIKLNDPFTIKIEDDITFKQIKDALKSTQILNSQVHIGNSTELKEIIKKTIRKYLEM